MVWQASSRRDEACHTTIIKLAVILSVPVSYKFIVRFLDEIHIFQCKHRPKTSLKILTFKNYLRYQRCIAKSIDQHVTHFPSTRYPGWSLGIKIGEHCLPNSDLIFPVYLIRNLLVIPVRMLRNHRYNAVTLTQRNVKQLCHVCNT